MPRYRYTSPFPAVLIGIRQGVEATVTRATGAAPPPEGSTVTAEPGDEITTVEPVEHAFLEELPDPAPTPVPTPVATTSLAQPPAAAPGTAPTATTAPAESQETAQP